MVSPLRNSSAGPTHFRSLKCNHRQAIQTQPGNPDRVDPISTGVQYLVLEMGPAPCRPICNPVQSQTFQVCITGTGSHSRDSGHPESALGGSGRLRLSSSLPAQPSDLQSDGSRLSQDDSDYSRLAQHALVLGPGHSFGSDPLQTSVTKGPGDTTGYFTRTSAI